MATGDKITYYGDALTITGENGLTLESPSSPLVIKGKGVGYNNLNVVSTNADFTSNDYQQITLVLRDKSGSPKGFLKAASANSKTNIAGIAASNSSATELNEIQAIIDDDGNRWTFAYPSSVINSIVTTTGISLSGNGYVKFGNGLIIQWGSISTPKINAKQVSNMTVSLNTPFSNSSYYVGVTLTADPGNSWTYRANTIAKSTTNFSIQWVTTEDISTTNGKAIWFALGY